MSRITYNDGYLELNEHGFCAVGEYAHTKLFKIQKERPAIMKQTGKTIDQVDALIMEKLLNLTLVI